MRGRLAEWGGVALVLCASALSCHSAESGKARQEDPSSSPPSGRSARMDSRIPTDPTAENYVLPPLPRARLLLKDAYGGSHAVEVEVAASGAARQRGLMWRKSLPPGTGMLFIFPAQQLQSFWMKNTLIPLDLIFIDKDKRIAGIAPQARPLTTNSQGVGKPSLYVLEVPGGWSEKTGIQLGSPVEMEGVSAIAVQP